MEVLETHEELIESKPEDISIVWKILQIFFYFLSAISGYGSSILFYILWHDIFADNCPLWAHIFSQIRTRQMPEEVPIEEDVAPTVLPNWRQSINVNFRYSRPCHLYHLISLCSCTFGIVWMTLFAMCGKGGYDTRMQVLKALEKVSIAGRQLKIMFSNFRISDEKFVAPWTVVPPAIVFQVIFTILVLVAVHDLENGYSTFLGGLRTVTSTVNDTQLATLERPCELLQSYLEVFGPPNYDVCRTYSALQTLSWIMAWSWILGLASLIIRIVSIRDFTLLTVTLYKVPEAKTEGSLHDGTSIPNIEIRSIYFPRLIVSALGLIFTLGWIIFQA